MYIFVEYKNIIVFKYVFTANSTAAQVILLPVVVALNKIYTDRLKSKLSAVSLKTEK